MKLNHRTFRVFYPSEYFADLFSSDSGRKDSILERLYEKETAMRSIENAAELKSEYDNLLKSSKWSHSETNSRLKTAKAILKNAQDEMNHFCETSISHYQQLMTFFGILFSILSLGLGNALLNNSETSVIVRTTIFAFLIVTLAGALVMYIKTAKMKDCNIRLSELFRNAFICFELFGNAADSLEHDEVDSAESSDVRHKRK